MNIRNIVAAGAVIAALLCGPAMAAGGRVALVIGNSSYSEVSPLPNPANDARDIAAALTRLGFTVTSGGDLDARGFKGALQEFEDKAAGADMAVVYYAGHGIEVGGTNYLIPTDARLKRDTHVGDEAIPLERVISSVQTAKGLKLVILDACRDNPFIAKMSRSPGATRSIGRGLARIEPENILVAYAAREGTVASDGSGRNSPYAEALLAYVEEPGLEVNKLLRRVRDKVVAATGGQQTPFVYGSIGGDDIFLKPAEVKPEPAPVPPPAIDMAALYNHAQGIGTTAAWDAFLETCKDSPYCKLGEAARAKLAVLPTTPAPEVQPASRVEATAPAVVVEPPAKAVPKKAKPAAKPRPQQATAAPSVPNAEPEKKRKRSQSTATMGSQLNRTLFPHLEKQKAQ